MNNNLILNAADNAVDILREHSPKILLGAGIALGIGAVTASGFSSYKAADVIKDIQCDPACDDKKVAFKNYMTRVVPLYIPVAILEAGSVVCLVKSYDINAKRLAAATALAEISVETLRLYREKTKQLIGPEKAEEIEKEVRKEELKKDEELRKNSDGEHWYNYDIQWFHDTLSDQDFMATVNDITRANLRFQERLNGGEMMMSKNEWLDILKEYSTPINDRYMIGPVPGGEDVGWLYGQSFHVYMDKVGKTKIGNHPCIILTYSDQPINNFREVHYRGW